MSYGEKIVQLRKSKGMTQAALGAELNVTYQAVSKWERDEATPDFATMSRIAKLFDVPLSFFEEDGESPEPASAQPAEPAEEKEPPEHPAVLAMLGVCTRCGKVVNEENLGESQPKLLCKTCKEEIAKEKREAEAQRKRAEAAKRESAELAEKMRKADYHRVRNRGLIASAFITPAVIAATVLLGVFIDAIPPWAVVVGVAFDLVFIYPFIAQLFWDGIVLDIVLAGVKIIGTPGIIFTFDLEGFFFLIVMKILFAVLKFVVLMVCVFFMAFVGIVVAPFAIVPQALKLTAGKEL